jgi:hypothetical protein
MVNGTGRHGGEARWFFCSQEGGAHLGAHGTTHADKPMRAP